MRRSELVYSPLEGLPLLADGEEGEGLTEDKVEIVAKTVEGLEELQDVVRVWTNVHNE